MKSFLCAIVITLPLSVYAAGNPIQDSYRGAAKQENAAFTDFSATRGEAFYKAKSGEVACATCHGDSPKAHGKHATTGKDILSALATPARWKSGSSATATTS
jgi:mono/diheme cytochrome c family protein